MKLYKIINNIGTYWVLAEHPTQAEEKLMKLLNDNDYGFFDKRKPTVIEVVAESADDRFLTGKFLVL